MSRASLVAQLVKSLPAMRETWVRSLGWEDPPEKRKKCQERRRRNVNVIYTAVCNIP